MISLRRVSFLLLLTLLAALGAQTSTAAAPKPHVLIFFVDDMGWAQPNGYGGKMAPTPHMDALAQSGVRFTDGYSFGSICSPGRVSPMTGCS
jgi:arylsulfatase A-like enzyme